MLQRLTVHFVIARTIVTPDRLAFLSGTTSELFLERIDSFDIVKPIAWS